MTTLEQLMEERGHKQRFIAEKTGISDYRLGYIKTDVNRMTAEEMVSLAAFFAIPLDEFAARMQIAQPVNA